VISAISAKGALCFAVLTVSCTLTAAGSIAFLQRLWHAAERTGVGRGSASWMTIRAPGQAVLRERVVPQ
jgi:hypothetical protein